MEKIKLHKAVGSALEDLINRGDLSIYGVLNELMMSPQNHIVEARKELEKLHDPWSLIMESLVNGYEVEQTPEDKVREIYVRYLPAYNGIGAIAIMDCLDALGITIPGVNGGDTE